MPAGIVCDFRDKKIDLWPLSFFILLSQSTNIKLVVGG